jgi:hypothetical protein
MVNEPAQARDQADEGHGLLPPVTPVQLAAADG